MFAKFKYRSEENELLDSPNVPKDLLFKNLHELDLLNKYLGGHENTLNGIRELLGNKDKTYHIADLGCGSGDIMKCLAKWGRREGYKLKFTGVDMNADVIGYLQNHCGEFPEVSGVCMNYREFLKNSSDIDIVLCTLFSHHLTDNELVDLFRWCRVNSKGFVINDIRRNRLAYYIVLFFTQIVGTKLARNDGPVSVLRSFTKTEIIGLLEKSGIKKYSIVRKWAFRWLIVGKCE